MPPRRGGDTKTTMRHSFSSWCNALRATLVPLLCLCLVRPALATELDVVYPRARSSLDDSYFLKVLELALAKSGQPHALRTSEREMEKGRALLELERGGDVRVVWCLTTRAREERLLPVRIPLDKGMMGWRVPLVHRDDAGRFRNVRRLADLSGMVAGQGFDWPDTAILRANGLTVATGKYDGLIKMLRARRFDYMPQSVLQVYSEAETESPNGLTVDDAFALHYPTAIYFFVRKNDRQLANALRRGLEIALADGSFDRLFFGFHQASIDRARLGERLVLELRNPDLPAATPLRENRLWYHPASAR
jgi:hypothetical protein